MSYGGAMVASVFHSEIAADMNAIGWNPFNYYSSGVLSSNHVSFYKGVPVIRHSIEGATSCSFYGIFLNRADVDATVLSHEWGHNVQAGLKGLPNYLFTIAAPSVTINLIARKNQFVYDNYFNFPWERSADWFGGVSRPQPEHKEFSLLFAIIYLLLTI